MRAYAFKDPGDSSRYCWRGLAIYDNALGQWDAFDLVHYYGWGTAYLGSSPSLMEVRFTYFPDLIPVRIDQTPEEIRKAAGLAAGEYEVGV